VIIESPGGQKFQYNVNDTTRAGNIYGSTVPLAGAAIFDAGPSVSSPGALAFATGSTNPIVFLTGNVASPPEVMRITSGGNLGIGTTNPGQKLDVSGSINLTGGIAGGTTYSGSGNITSTAGVLTISGTGNSSIAGNLGIGTTGPGQALHVVGAGYFTTGLGVADTNITSGVVNVGTGFRIVNAAGAGKILRGDGTNFVGSTATFADTYTASNLLYSNGANTVTGLATANDGVLITSATGVPSISSTIPSVTQKNITAVSSALATGLLQVTTTTGALSSVTTSAGISTLLSDETGSGALVFGTSPTFTTSVIMSDGATISTPASA